MKQTVSAAQAMVARYRVRGPAELKSALRLALEADGPVVIEVPLEPDSDASRWRFLHPWS